MIFLRNSLKNPLFPRFFFSTENISKLQQEKYIIQHDKAVKLLKSKLFPEALEIFSDLIESNQNLKGSVAYADLLKAQSHCYFNLRNYKEAEINYMNIVEYNRYNIKSKNIEFNNSKLYESYCNMFSFFIYSGGEKGLELIKNIENDEFYSKFDLHQQGNFANLTAILYLLNKNHDQALYYFLRAINMNNSHAHLVSTIIHNMAILNLWSIKDQNLEIQILKKEIEEIEKQSSNDYHNENLKKRENLMIQKFQKENSKDILKNLLFSLSIQKQDFKMTFEKLLEKEDFKGLQLGTILALAEIFLSFNDQKNHELGKNLLNKTYNNLKYSKKSLKARTIVLYAAYFIDNKKDSEAKQILLSLINGKVEPYEDYYVVMAYQFLCILSKKVPEEKKYAENYLKLAEEYEKAKNIPKWANRMVWLQTP